MTVPTTNKRVWADNEALAADLEKLGFSVDHTNGARPFKFYRHYIWGHVPYKAYYGPGDLNGIPGATISGVGRVIDGAARIDWKVEVETYRHSEDIGTVTIEPIMATNRASLVHQLRSHYAAATKINPNVAHRFNELLDGSSLEYELQGKDPKTRFRQGGYHPKAQPTDAAARRGTLTLGKSLGTRQIESLAPGSRLELSHKGDYQGTFIVVEAKKGRLVLADKEGLYELKPEQLRAESVAKLSGLSVARCGREPDMAKHKLKLTEEQEAVRSRVVRRLK